jgi:hypothetical protein
MWFAYWPSAQKIPDYISISTSIIRNKRYKIFIINVRIMIRFHRIMGQKHLLKLLEYQTCLRQSPMSNTILATYVILQAELLK